MNSRAVLGMSHSARLATRAVAERRPSGEVASPGVSGVGEVMGMHALDEDFKTLHLNIGRSEDLPLTSTTPKARILIFLGSPASNQTLNELQTTDDFVFRTIRLWIGQNGAGNSQQPTRAGRSTISS